MIDKTFLKEDHLLFIYEIFKTLLFFFLYQIYFNEIMVGNKKKAFKLTGQSFHRM